MKPMGLSAYREIILKILMRWHREALPPSHCHLTVYPGVPWHCCGQTQSPATSFGSSLCALPMATADILNLSVKLFQRKGSENCLTGKKTETISSQYPSVVLPHLAHMWTPSLVPQASHACFITLPSEEAEVAAASPPACCSLAGACLIWVLRTMCVPNPSSCCCQQRHFSGVHYHHKTRASLRLLSVTAHDPHSPHTTTWSPCLGNHLASPCGE